MKLLSILFLLVFISCEQQPEVGTEEDKVGKSTFTTTDISEEYYGIYSSTCKADSALEFGQGKEISITLDSGAPVMTVKEYGESDCRTLLVTRSYELAFKVESQLYESPSQIINILEIEYISSTLHLNHSAYNGYWDCGFTANLDTDYVLNSPCRSNLDNTIEKYEIKKVSNNQVTLQKNLETITLTKQ